MNLPADRDIALAFGAVLRLVCTHAHLSQEAVAERASLDRTTPSLYVKRTSSADD